MRQKEKFQKFAELNNWSPEKQVEILLKIIEDYPVKFDPFFDYLLRIAEKWPE